MSHIEKMVELANNEFASMAQNGKFRTREEIDTAYKLMDIVKDAYCIMDMEEASYDGGSYRGSYDGSSYRGTRRDSMGRYSREGSYRGYSRNEYSGDMGEFRDRVQNLMEYAPDEKTRNSMKRVLEQIQG